MHLDTCAFYSWSSLTSVKDDRQDSDSNCIMIKVNFSYCYLSMIIMQKIIYVGTEFEDLLKIILLQYLKVTAKSKELSKERGKIHVSATISTNAFD